MTQYRRGSGYCQDPLAGVPVAPGTQDFIVLDTVADLRAYVFSQASFPDGQLIYVKGYHSAEDGGGGIFNYHRTGTVTDDGGVFIIPDNGFGYFERQVNTLPVNARWFGATGDGTTDDTEALQAAIDYCDGSPLYVPEGSFRVTETLVWGTSDSLAPGLKIRGAGIGKTVFLSAVASGPCFSAFSDTEYNFQTGVEMSDFSILPYGVPANSSGIRLKGVWQSRFSMLQIRGLSLHGVLIESETGDGDACAHLTFDSLDLSANGGYGLFVDATDTAFGVSNFQLSDSVVRANALGGARCSGLGMRFLRNSFAQNRGVGGLYIPEVFFGSQTVNISDNEFDSNAVQHCRVENTLGGFFWNNEMTFQDDGSGYGFRPTLGLVLGSTALIRGFRASNNRLRSNPTNPSSATTAFQVGSFCTNVRVDTPIIQAFSGGNATVLSDAGTNTFWEDGDGLGLQTLKTALVTASASPVVPDMLAGLFQRIGVTIAAVTISPPTPASPPDGRELVLCIINSSGGAITVTFDAVYGVQGYTDPANGQRTSARFAYDDTTNLWTQVGAWS